MVDACEALRTGALYRVVAVLITVRRGLWGRSPSLALGARNAENSSPSPCPLRAGDVRTLSPLRHRRPCAVGLGRFPARRLCSERGHIAAQPWGHRNRATEGGCAPHQLASLGGQKGCGEGWVLGRGQGGSMRGR